MFVVSGEVFSKTGQSFALGQQAVLVEDDGRGPLVRAVEPDVVLRPPFQQPERQRTRRRPVALVGRRLHLLPPSMVSPRRRPIKKRERERERERE